jgi:mxaJ protein
MSSLCLKAAVAWLLLAGSAEARDLRVCADPNNLPFSNARGEGFENKIAQLVARDLKASLSYTWWAQRRGFLRNTLEANLCDLVPGVPASMEMLRTTEPYYRSTYVFVTRAGRAQPVSLDDPALKRLTVGVQMIGDDGANSPPAHALMRRGLVTNIRGYTVYGDYGRPNPPADIVKAVAQGDVDVALVWGPLAGYFAPRQAVKLHLSPVTPQIDGPTLPMVFDISMGVRKDDQALRDAVDASLRRHRADIARILTAYGVPRLDDTQSVAAR